MAIGDQYYVSIGADTTKLVASVNETITKMPTVKLNVDGSRVTTQYKNITTATGEVYSVTQKTKQSLDGVTSSLGSTTKQLDTASKSTKTLGQDFIETAGKVAKFGAITAILGLFTSAVMAAKDAIFELDASMVELRKVSDLGGESLESYKESAYDLARELSTSATNITDAVTEFSKSGYSIAESLELAETATVFQTIADDALTASESATFLIQVMKAYNMTAEESVDIIDKINEVSNNYAISSSDLSDNLGKVASTAALAGINFDELLGLILGLVKPI